MSANTSELVTLEEVKLSMKIDTNDDDNLIRTYLNSAISKVKDMLRVTDFSSFNDEQKAQIKSAIFYATSYLYDFRENKDDKIWDLNIRGLLGNLREVKF